MPPSASSTPSSGPDAPPLAPSISPSGSDASSSELAVPLPGPAVHQVQQPRPTDISQYGETYALNNAGQTLVEFHTGH